MVSIAIPLAVVARWTADRKFASPMPPIWSSGISRADPGGSVSNSPRIPWINWWCFPRLFLLRPEIATWRYFRTEGLGLFFGSFVIGMYHLYDIYNDTIGRAIRQF